MQLISNLTWNILSMNNASEAGNTTVRMFYAHLYILCSVVADGGPDAVKVLQSEGEFLAR